MCFTFISYLCALLLSNSLQLVAANIFLKVMSTIRSVSFAYTTSTNNMAASAFSLIAAGFFYSLVPLAVVWGFVFSIYALATRFRVELFLYITISHCLVNMLSTPYALVFLAAIMEITYSRRSFCSVSLLKCFFSEVSMEFCPDYCSPVPPVGILVGIFR